MNATTETVDSIVGDIRQMIGQHDWRTRRSEMVPNVRSAWENLDAVDRLLAQHDWRTRQAQTVQEIDEREPAPVISLAERRRSAASETLDLCP